jgi:hypothetical protein
MFTICDNGDNRKMTKEEIAEQEAYIEAVNQIKSLEVSRAEAKAALLTRLGITDQEAKLLLL